MFFVIFWTALVRYTWLSNSSRCFFPTISTFGCFWSQWPTSLAVTSGCPTMRCGRLPSRSDVNIKKSFFWLLQLLGRTQHNIYIYRYRCKYIYRYTYHLYYIYTHIYTYTYTYTKTDHSHSALGWAHYNYPQRDFSSLVTLPILEITPTRALKRNPAAWALPFFVGFGACTRHAHGTAVQEPALGQSTPSGNFHTVLMDRSFPCL